MSDQTLELTAKMEVRLVFYFLWAWAGGIIRVLVLPLALIGQLQRRLIFPGALQLKLQQSRHVTSYRLIALSIFQFRLWEIQHQLYQDLKEHHKILPKGVCLPDVTEIFCGGCMFQSAILLVEISIVLVTWNIHLPQVFFISQGTVENAPKKHAMLFFTLC